jgi:hypothetical protein
LPDWSSTETVAEETTAPDSNLPPAPLFTGRRPSLTPAAATDFELASMEPPGRSSTDQFQPGFETWNALDTVRREMAELERREERKLQKDEHRCSFEESQAEEIEDGR